MMTDPWSGEHDTNGPMSTCNQRYGSETLQNPCVVQGVKSCLPPLTQKRHILGSHAKPQCTVQALEIRERQDRAVCYSLCSVPVRGTKQQHTLSVDAGRFGSTVVCSSHALIDINVAVGPFKPAYEICRQSCP